MNRIKLKGFIDQAEAMVDAHVSSFKYEPGEYPDIRIGEWAGRALDFLKKSGVPVTGFTVNVCVVLTLEIPGKEPIVERIPIKETIPIDKTREFLRRTVDDFSMTHGKRPSQNIEHGVVFLTDERQIED